MDSHNILSLLGLALRGGRLAVGEEPVEAAARAKDARLLLMAADAAAGTVRRVVHFSQVGQCLYLTLPCSKAELGHALGRSSAAVAAVTDTGLANAVARRLAELDPEQYGQAAERLALKAQRAAQRQAERKAHMRNVRQGVRKAKPPAPKPTPAPESRPEKGVPPARKTPSAVRRDAPGERRSQSPAKAGGRKSPSSAPARGGPRSNPYAHSRPVKKGKGSFRRAKS